MALNPKSLRLYLVTDRELCAQMGVFNTVAKAVQGGVSFIQLRDKLTSTAQQVELAKALKAVLAEHAVPLVINDNVEAALAADVDGLHLGQDDMAASDARAKLGPNKLIGLSCETEALVRKADTSVVDYLGIGPVFDTPTKGDHKPAIGMNGLARLCALSSLPTVAIGGLKAQHASDVQAAGADGMAVVSAICGQDDPTAAARSLSQNLGEI